MKNNINILSYFLCRTLFLGGGLSILFLNAGTDTYIAVFLGILLGIGIIYLFSLLTKKINMPIKEFLKGKKFINILFRIIYFCYLIFLAFVLLIIISTFIYSYFLPFTPSIVSCLPLIFIACFLNSKKSSNIANVGFVLMIISIFIIILKTSLISTEFHFKNFLPILTSKPIDIFKGAILYSILSTAPFFTFIGEKFEFKESIKYYLIASIANFIVLLSITLTMGDMIKVYSYPEYSILKKIRLFNFIENIENIISASWFFDIFIGLSIVSLKIKETINLKKTIIPFSLIAIMMFFIHKFISDNFYNSMLVYKSFTYIFVAFMILLAIILIIKIKTNKKQQQN